MNQHTIELANLEKERGQKRLSEEDNYDIIRSELKKLLIKLKRLEESGIQMICDKYKDAYPSDLAQMLDSIRDDMR